MINDLFDELNTVVTRTLAYFTIDGEGDYEFKRAIVSAAVIGLYNPQIPFAKLVYVTDLYAFAIYEISIWNRDKYERIEIDDRNRFMFNLGELEEKYSAIFGKPNMVAVKVELEEAEKHLIEKLVEIGYTVNKIEGYNSVYYAELLWFAGNTDSLKIIKGFVNNFIDSYLGDQ